MERRARRHASPNNTAAYLRYLKPGALAQLRDSRISAARTHRFTKSVVQVQICASPSRPPAPTSPGSPAQINGPPSSPSFFTARIYGPRCPQRKKLMAARAVFAPNPNLATGSDSTGQGQRQLQAGFCLGYSYAMNTRGCCSRGFSWRREKLSDHRPRL